MNIPNDLQPVERDNGSIVFAYGEVTGHKHQVAVEDRGNCALLESPSRTAEDALLNVRFLRVMQGCEIRVVHEEHATLTLSSEAPEQQAQGDVYFERVAPDLWRVNQQREWTDADEPIRVAD